MRVCLHLSVALLAILSTGVSQSAKVTTESAFAAAAVTPKEQKEILEFVEHSAFDTPESWAQELQVKQIDLGAAPGLLIKGTHLLCGATGNCQIWIFRKANGKWLSMLNADQTVLVDNVQLGPLRTRGIKDLILSSNSSAERSDSVVYRFDGNVYRPK